jgi:hypothetical protein
MSASDLELVPHHNRTILKVGWDRALRIYLNKIEGLQADQPT